MDARTKRVPLCKILDLDQETIIDIDGEIYEPDISLGHFTKLKKKIESKN